MFEENLMLAYGLAGRPVLDGLFGLA